MTAPRAFLDRSVAALGGAVFALVLSLTCTLVAWHALQSQRNLPDQALHLMMWLAGVASIAITTAVYGLLAERSTIPLRRQLALDLGERDSWYAELIASAADPILILSPLGHVDALNAAAEEISGFSREEIIGRHFAQIGVLTSGGLAKATQELALLMAGQIRPPYELEMIRKNGSRFTVELNAQLIRYKGKVAGIQVICRNVTERKAMEEALRTSSQRLRLLAEHMDDALFVYGMDRKLQFVNPAFRLLTGFAMEELGDQPFVGYVHPEDRQRVMQRWEAAFRGEAFAEEEFRIVTKQGQAKWCLGIGGPLMDPGGAQVGVLLRQTDITRRKWLEEQRRQQAEALSQTNTRLLEQQRTMQQLLTDLEHSKRQLEQQAESLAEANQRLQSLSLLKDEFVANVSHEVRTPLTAIKEGISLMRDAALGPVTPEQGDFLKTVDENIDRLTDLVNNMLDLSKIEAGRLRLVRKALSLNALLESTVKSYRALAKQRRLVVEASALPPVLADENRIAQVLNNFVSNALKFTPAQGTITLRAAVEGDHVVVSVTDDGVGIATQDLSRLFHKFSQVGALEEKSKGTGLGLVLCKQLIELHRGEIRVTSASGKGSTFSFTLPVYTPALALEETFRDFQELVRRSEAGQGVVIALDATPLLTQEQPQGAVVCAGSLDQAAETVRRHVHRGDVVLTQAPQWVVILAVTDGPGAEAMVQRLQPVLEKYREQLGVSKMPVACGLVFYPMEGQQWAALLSRAMQQATAKAERGEVHGAHPARRG